MKKQAKTVAAAAKPKPDTAPDQYQAIVLFKSGATLNLRFDGSGQLQQFQQAFQQWAENASGKKPGGDYQVVGWQTASGNWASHQITIAWDTVAAINYTR